MPGRLRGVLLGYPLHPFTVHFPIALLLTASALEVLGVWRGESHRDQTLWLLRIGWWTSILTLVTGTIDLIRQWGQVQQALGWVNAHVALSLAVVFIYGRLALQRQPTDRTRLRLHLVGALLLILTGFVGGHLVYNLNFGRAL